MVIRSAESVDFLHIPSATRNARGVNITALGGGIVGLDYHLGHIMGLGQRYLYADSRNEGNQLPSMPDGLGISEILGGARAAEERPTYILQRRTSRGVRDLHGERWGRGSSALTFCNTERNGVSGVCKRNVGVAEERSTYILQGQTRRTSAGLQDNASGARVSHLLSVTPNGPNVSGSCTTRGGGDGGRSTYMLRRRIGRTSARST